MNTFKDSYDYVSSLIKEKPMPKLLAPSIKGITLEQTRERLKRTIEKINATGVVKVSMESKTFGNVP